MKVVNVELINNDNNKFLTSVLNADVKDITFNIVKNELVMKAKHIDLILPHNDELLTFLELRQLKTCIFTFDNNSKKSIDVPYQGVVKNELQKVLTKRNIKLLITEQFNLYGGKNDD